MVKYEDIASMIDYSMLKPTITDKEIEAGCATAKKYGVATVCVRPSDVPLASRLLKGSPVLVCTVIGFPHGTTTTSAKVCESKQAMEDGSKELDMVINIGKMKSGDYDFVKRDIQTVVDLAHSRGVKVKVIFENCTLTEQEIIKATEICNEAGADWIKTSTGFGSGGAEDKDIKVMIKYAKPGVQVKAAGGIKTLERAIEVRNLGCTRIGCSSPAEILDRLK
jgi:deoxyribose-phosphate aldolase